jgi:hypothetical protein
MRTPSPTSIFKSVIDLLTEAYIGPADPSSTWFVDNEPDSRILGIIKGISASEASMSVDGSGGTGSTIASNVEHLRWSLASMNAVIRGESQGDWSKSWQLKIVGKVEWDRLRNALQTEFETLRQALENQTDLPEEYLTGLLSLLPHAAFHLELIRQMISRLYP